MEKILRAALAVIFFSRELPFFPLSKCLNRLKPVINIIFMFAWFSLQEADWLAMVKVSKWSFDRRKVLVSFVEFWKWRASSACTKVTRPEHCVFSLYAWVRKGTSWVVLQHSYFSELYIGTFQDRKVLWLQLSPAVFSDAVFTSAPKQVRRNTLAQMSFPC